MTVTKQLAHQIPLTMHRYRRVYWALSSGDGMGDLDAVEREAYMALVYWPGDNFGQFHDRNRGRVQETEEVSA